MACYAVSLVIIGYDAEWRNKSSAIESVDKGTLATLRREGQAQFTCAVKPRSERAFTKPGFAGFVIILNGGTCVPPYSLFFRYPQVAEVGNGAVINPQANAPCALWEADVLHHKHLFAIYKSLYCAALNF